MSTNNPQDRNRAPHERDDLDEMIEEVEKDPVAHAAYEETLRRKGLLRALVEARGDATQQAIADKMGTTQSAVSDIETGRVDARFSTLQRYARAVDRQLEVAVASADDAEQVREQLRAVSVQGVLTEVYQKQPKVGPQSPTEVAERTGLPQDFVGHTMNRLWRTGWLNTVSPTTSREPQFSLRDDRGLVLGVSISRSHVHAVLTDLRTNQLIARQEHALPDTSPRTVIDAVVSLARELSRKAGIGREVVGLGVVVAGRVDGATGMVNFAPDLQTREYPWNGVPLEADLEDALQGSGNFRVVVENDANALGMHEYLLQGEDESVAVVLLSRGGKGIGGGLVINRDIAHGFGGVSGEIGHIVVDPDGHPCRCGARGCLETVASASAIVDRTKELSSAPITTLDEAAALVESGDLAATRAFAEAGEALGRVLFSVTAIVGPRRLVIVGPPQLVQEPDIASAQVFLEGARRTHTRAILGVKIDLSSKVMNDTTLPVAAAATAVRHFLSHPERWSQSLADVELFTNDESAALGAFTNWSWAFQLRRPSKEFAGYLGNPAWSLQRTR